VVITQSAAIQEELTGRENLSYVEHTAQPETTRPLHTGQIPRSGGLHPKSEIADQASPTPRRLVIEWTAQLLADGEAFHDHGGVPVLQARKPAVIMKRPVMIAADARSGGIASQIRNP
jgi:hypothetical protein